MPSTSTCSTPELRSWGVGELKIIAAILERPVIEKNVADTIGRSCRTVAKIRQNLFCAFAYNAIGLPLAAFGLLNPVIAGAAMALSSVSVAANVLTLRRGGCGPAGEPARISPATRPQSLEECEQEPRSMDTPQRPTRRSAITLLALPLAGLATAQTVVETSLADLRRYLVAASNLVLGLTARAEAIDPAAVPLAQRAEVVAELKGVSSAIARLRASNEILLMDLSWYLEGVRSGRFDDESRRGAWYQVSRSVSAVSEVVRRTQKVVEGSRWLDTSLSDADRLTLERTLQGRGILLGRLSSLPPPVTPVEIEEVDRINGHYRRLVESMDRLNEAVAGAARRLAAA
jgi:hypothetical protein